MDPLFASISSARTIANSKDNTVLAALEAPAQLWWIARQRRALIGASRTMLESLIEDGVDTTTAFKPAMQGARDVASEPHFVIEVLQQWRSGAVTNEQAVHMLEHTSHNPMWMLTRVDEAALEEALYPAQASPEGVSAR